MENPFMTAAEVAQQLGVSKGYAYKLMRQLNAELQKKGYVTVTGRLNRRYFMERLYMTQWTQEVK